MDQRFEPADFSSVTAGARSLSTVAMRVGSALARSLGKLPAAAHKQALEVLTVENLWTTALILVVWLCASVIGGPIGLVVNGILVALALYQLPQLAAELGTALKDGLVTAYEAKNDADLDRAAASFAGAFSALGIEILQVFVTHRLFVFAKPKLVNRFRVPPQVEAEHRKATSKLRERLKEASELPGVKTAAEVAAAAGVKPAADAFPTLAVVGVGTVVLAGTGLALFALSKGDSK